jgi:hypothetical protein
MKGLTTWLSGTVESVLPRTLPSTTAAACVSRASYCQTEVLDNGGRIETYHRYCHLSCHGKLLGCNGWTPGGC